MPLESPGPVKSKNIALTHGGATTTTLVAAAAGKRLRVVSIVANSSQTVTLTVEDTDGTDLIGPCPVAANYGLTLPESSNGWAETADGKGLALASSGAANIGGVLLYQEF